MKTTLIALSLLVLIVLGCNMSEPSSRRTTHERISTDAESLFAAYEANEVSADQRYKDKWLDVSGTIDAIGKDVVDSMYVTLRSGDEFQIGNVQCMFDDKHQSQLASLRKGQKVTLSGLCSGKFGNVILRQCEIVKAS